jgi:hypothetical protein
LKLPSLKPNQTNPSTHSKNPIGGVLLLVL